MKLIIESWRRFLKEAKSPLPDEAQEFLNIAKSAADDILSKEKEKEIDFSPNVNQNHVQNAKTEYVKFKKGRIQEHDPEAWEIIAGYYKHSGIDWLVNRIKKGYYRKQPNKHPWSAAWIQYCMRDNEDFKKLQHQSSNVVNHKWYWKAARDNTNIFIKDPSNLEKTAWIFLTDEQMKEIGYTPQIGDIAMAKGVTGPYHGDIVTDIGKIGGNLGGKDANPKLSGTCTITNSKTHAVVTQNPIAKDKLFNKTNTVS